MAGRIGSTEIARGQRQFRMIPDDDAQYVTRPDTVIVIATRVAVARLVSVGQVRNELTRRMARAIVDPQLDVKVVAFRSQKAYVSGEVTSPGVLPIRAQRSTL